ncbi:MAG: EAL domain-containing protein [Gammaproteobacteria bacterium]|nr:EAL domain-containing protein [Gammaproteobacteria bacterium]
MNAINKILIIDDDADYVEAQQEFLQDNGYRTIVARSEAEAKQIILSDDIHVSLVDIRLGKEYGVSLVHELKEIKPDLICIMVTAYVSLPAAVDAIKQGAFEYLAKPINPESLLATLERAFTLIKAHNERDIAREALQREQDRAQVTLDAIADGVISTDVNARVEYMNPAAERMTGWMLGIARGISIDKIVCLRNEENEKVVDNPVYKCMREQLTLDIPKSVLLMRSDGASICVEHSAAPLRDTRHNIKGSVLVLRDVTEAKKLAERISYQAQHDSLTGLINRMEFEDRLNRVFRAVKSNSTTNVLLYIDLDQFKVVNDTCGHVAGDELLCQLTALFSQNIKNNMTLGRLGGDEFGLLVENSTLEQAYEIAEKILRVCNDFRFNWQDKTFTIGASIGMVSIDSETIKVSDILIQADTACYTAKDMGRNRIHVYQLGDIDSQKRHGEMQWVSKINKAFEDDRFCLFCQSIIAIDGSENDKAHYELLVRMRDEDGLLIPPGAFIAAAERYNLMINIDRWVVKTAFSILTEDKPLLDNLALCTINLSGQTLSDQDFARYINDLFDNSPVPPSKICFEVTETAAISNLKNAMHFLHQLKLKGCMFALDDFGSGLSSFAYLKNLPVDYLKIDGSFVKDMATDPIDCAMVKSINDVGHVMGKKIIAEFVENQEILHMLQEMGVDYAQGYGISKPEAFGEKQRRH